MNSKNLVWAALIIIIVLVGGYFILHNKPASTPEPIVPVVDNDNGGNLKTFTDSASGISFSYPEKLGTTYINTVDWPPKVQLIEEAFACHPAGSETSQAGITENLTVNGHTYCVTRESEGAAGSTYTNYAYAFPNNDNTIILTFSLRFPQCANYEDPQKTACESEKNSLNINNVVDQIRGSISFQ